MDKLLYLYKGWRLYFAGLPGFGRNFTRDSIISALLTNDAAMLGDQLRFCADSQGQQPNSYDGEEPGKIHHEIPATVIAGLSTKYNACDTTALFLIGHRRYFELTADRSLIKSQEKNIKMAVSYILNHLRDDFFIEDPSYCGAAHFALKVTYWKDSCLPKRVNGQPVYPVIYPLADVQNISALRSASALLGDSSLKIKAQKMVRKLMDLFDQERGIFYIAKDSAGSISGAASDSLHLLYYLEPGDLSSDVLEKLVDSSKVLETKIGYRTLDQQTAQYSSDPYHSKTVWPFEQALINIAATRFGLSAAAEVSSRIIERLRMDQGFDPEIYEMVTDLGERGGCDTQLWTIAAKRYFASLLSNDSLFKN